MGLKNTQNIQESFQVVSGMEQETIAKASNLQSSMQVIAQTAYEQGKLNKAWSAREAIDSDMMFSASTEAVNDEQYFGRSGLADQHSAMSQQLAVQSNYAFGLAAAADAKAAQARQQSVRNSAVVEQIKSRVLAAVEEQKQEQPPEHNLSTPAPFGRAA